MKKLLLSTVLAMGLSTSVFAGGGGDILRASLMVDNLEYQFNDEKTISWDSYAYVGYDLNKIYLYSEGEKAKDATSAESENQLVYSRAISPYWDVQVGVGYDKSNEDDKTWGVLGVQGLAPYFFETRAVVLVGKGGDVGFRAEAEYEALFTQKLILTPSIGISAYSNDVSNLTFGARLRYEIVREFTPYIGIEWSKDFAHTDDTISSDEVYATAGLRFWF